nr:cytidylate kinase family protein [Prevotella sp.]
MSSHFYSERSLQEVIRRYFCFLVSLFVIAFGTSLSIRANLGSSPISCPAYVLSLVPHFPLTMGGLVFLMHITLILVQIVILRSKYNPFQLLQIVVGVVFGYFTDVTMWITGYMQIMNDTLPGYGLRFVQLLLGGAILGYGIACEVKTDTLTLATEGVQIVIARVLNKDFGKIKIITDTSLVVIGVILCFIFFGHWDWKLIGIGTLIAMFYVGFMVRRYNKHLTWLENFMNVGMKSSNQPSISERNDATCPLVITISREYGSGGCEIGEKLSKLLNIPLYDRQLIEITAGKLGYSPEFVAGKEQNISTSKLWEAIFTDNSIPESLNLSHDDAIFVVQSKTIKQLAVSQSCIIIGRLANWVLRDRKNCLRVYCCAGNDTSVKEIMKRDNLNAADSAAKIIKVNKSRANHYYKYTGHRWDDIHDYDLVINTSAVSYDGAVTMIANAVRNIDLQNNVVQ